MYFSNISDEEYGLFGEIYVPNFTIGFSDLINSKLFKSEIIIPDSVYRICPLFNCKKIVSTNPNDKIIGTECIIYNKTSNNNFLHFIFNENEEFYDYGEILNDFYLDTAYSNYLGSKLSAADLHSYVYAMRKNIKTYEEINISDNITQGTFANYEIELDDAVLIDNGYLVEKGNSNVLGNVTLLNPNFIYSSYKLKLEIWSFNVNVENGDNTSNINKDIIEINLIKNTPVNIEYETEATHIIIRFVNTVEITHNLPIINFGENVLLTISDEEIDIGESITLEALYHDKDLQILPNADINYYANNNLFGTSKTNDEGTSIIEFKPEAYGEYNIVASKNTTYSNNEILVVNGIETDYWDFEPYLLNPTLLEIGGKFVIKDTEDTIPHKRINIYDGQTLIATVRTNEYGAFSKFITVEKNEYRFKAEFEGDEIYEPSISDEVYIGTGGGA